MRKLALILSLILCVGLEAVFAQTRNISGTVTGKDDGQPIPGVSVSVKGTTVGTITRMDGKYDLSVPADATTLVFSFVGMKTQEVSIVGQSSISVTLESETIGMEEVVVTALGIKRSEKALGYAASQVDPSATQLKSEPDMLKSLQGKVAGVDIRSSQGTPGAATRINIRGNSSFFGNNEPLIIVDGVPLSNGQVTTSDQTSGGGAYTNGLSSLDPNDIASMTVLKGSAAAALYGSRASNGVVLIKTKSGSVSNQAKKFEVALNSSWSVEEIANLPDYQNSYGAGAGFRYSNANGSWGPKFGTIESIPVWPEYLANYPELFDGTTMPYVAKPNNVKDLFDKGLVKDNSVNFSGSNGKTGFNATLSYLDHKGYIPHSNYDRTSISVGGNSELANGLNIRGSLSFSTANQKGSIFGENQVEGASSSMARTLFLARTWDIAGLPYEKLDGTPISTNSSQYDNPLWAWKHNTSTTKTDRVSANFGLEYKITDWFSVSYQIGTNLYTLGRKEVIDIGSRAAGGKGRLTTDDYREVETESNLLATFEKDFLDDFSVRFVTGHNLNSREYTRRTLEGNEFNVPNIYNLSNTKTVTTTDDILNRRRLVGVFGDLTLGYKNFAFINVTGRNDWSSTLPVNNRSYFYPALSGSFVFSDAFKLQNDVFSYGKLRAGWAKVGRDADPYYLNDIYILLDPFNNNSMARVSTTARNPRLKPEFTEELEAGAQLEFFKRRLALDFTWYNKLSKSQIATISLPYSSGYMEAVSNFGEIKNTGVEIDANVKVIETKSFGWDIHGTFTKNKNTVEKLIDGVDRIQLEGVLTDISPYLEVGKPFGYLRGTVNVRDNEGNLLIDPSTGLLIVATEQQMVGDPNPDFKLGLGTTLTFKGFFATAQFDWTQGGDIYSVTVNSLLGRGVTKDTEDREHSWVIPGYYGNPNTGTPILDTNGNKIPNTTQVSTNDLYFGDSFAINGATEWSVYDATVYRLREVTVGYDLPKKMLERTPFGSVQVSLSGRNLWYFAPGVPDHTNFDPEVNSFGATSTQGIELSTAPTTRRYGFNLKLTF